LRERRDTLINVLVPGDSGVSELVNRIKVTTEAAYAGSITGKSQLFKKLVYVYNNDYLPAKNAITTQLCFTKKLKDLPSHCVVGYLKQIFYKKFGSQVIDIQVVDADDDNLLGGGNTLRMVKGTIYASQEATMIELLVSAAHEITHLISGTLGNETLARLNDIEILREMLSEALSMEQALTELDADPAVTVDAGLETQMLNLINTLKYIVYDYEVNILTAALLHDNHEEAEELKGHIYAEGSFNNVPSLLYGHELFELVLGSTYFDSFRIHAEAKEEMVNAVKAVVDNLGEITAVNVNRTSNADKAEDIMNELFYHITNRIVRKESYVVYTALNEVLNDADTFIALVFARGITAESETAELITPLINAHDAGNLDYIKRAVILSALAHIASITGTNGPTTLQRTNIISKLVTVLGNSAKEHTELSKAAKGLLEIVCSESVAESVKEGIIDSAAGLFTVNLKAQYNIETFFRDISRSDSVSASLKEKLLENNNDFITYFENTESPDIEALGRISLNDAVNAAIGSTIRGRYITRLLELTEGEWAGIKTDEAWLYTALGELGKYAAQVEKEEIAGVLAAKYNKRSSKMHVYIGSALVKIARSDTTGAIKTDVIEALKLEGRYLDIFRSFDILAIDLDDTEFSDIELDWIYELAENLNDSGLTDIVTTVSRSSATTRLRLDDRTGEITNLDTGETIDYDLHNIVLCDSFVSELEEPLVFPGKTGPVLTWRIFADAETLAHEWGHLVYCQLSLTVRRNIEAYYKAALSNKDNFVDDADNASKDSKEFFACAFQKYIMDSTWLVNHANKQVADKSDSNLLEVVKIIADQFKHTVDTVDKAYVFCWTEEGLEREEVDITAGVPVVSGDPFAGKTAIDFDSNKITNAIYNLDLYIRSVGNSLKNAVEKNTLSAEKDEGYAGLIRVLNFLKEAVTAGEGFLYDQLVKIGITDNTVIDALISNITNRASGDKFNEVIDLGDAGLNETAGKLLSRLKIVTYILLYDLADELRGSFTGDDLYEKLRELSEQYIGQHGFFANYTDPLAMDVFDDAYLEYSGDSLTQASGYLADSLPISNLMKAIGAADKDREEKEKQAAEKALKVKLEKETGMDVEIDTAGAYSAEVEVKRYKGAVVLRLLTQGEIDETQARIMLCKIDNPLMSYGKIAEKLDIEEARVREVFTKEAVPAGLYYKAADSIFYRDEDFVNGIIADSEDDTAEALIYAILEKQLLLPHERDLLENGYICRFGKPIFYKTHYRCRY